MPVDLNAMPKLGFGLMRLPETDGKIDLPHVCRMVDAYLNAGMNYFDTLSGNLICVICLQQLFRIPLNRMIVGILLLAACVFLALSASFSIVFNLRIHNGLEEFEQAVASEPVLPEPPSSLPEGKEAPV